MAGLGLALAMSVAMAGGAADGENTTMLSRLEPAFRNTLQITYADGRIGRMWLDRDGRYRGHGRRESSGVWRVRGEELCLTQRRPIPVPVSFCTPMVEGGVGTRWTTRSVTGEQLVVEIVRGR